jgi:ABC-type transport system involved in multi-copper enzyme maturation permease subunit
VTAQLRSELLKIRSTRTTLGLTLGMVAFLALIAILSVYTQSTSDVFFSEQQRDLLAIAAIAEVFAALVGIMAVTSEFRHGTSRPTFLAEPRRVRVIAAKAVAGALAGLALGLVAFGLTYGITRVGLSTRGVDFVVEGGDVGSLLLGIVVASALWGVLGVGLGALVRSQVGAIVGLLVWTLVAEHILFALVPSVGRYFPNSASEALSGASTDDLLEPVAGGLVFAAYAAVAAAAGALVTEKRDVG